MIQGSMATTAILALKPLKTLSAFTDLGLGSGKLIFLHTANPDSQMDQKLTTHLAGIESTNANTIVLQAGQTNKQQKQGKQIYDYCMSEFHETTAVTNSYKIIRKGNIHIGLISARPDEEDVIQKVNTLSSYLKNEKDCAIVVCLSQLGYKNKNTPDDITLAKQSNHLDFIIGGNDQNVYPHPVILLNQNNEEVIIHAAANDSATFGKIDLDINEQGQKKYISFSYC